MHNRASEQPLHLEVGERTITFTEPADFEFALESRTEVPAAKVAELTRMAPDALRDEAARIRKVERMFIDVLAHSLEETGNIDYLLRELEPTLFSSDHEWRALMVALAAQPVEFDDYKKIALVKYVQYMAAREDVLRSIYADKRSRGAPGEAGEAEPPVVPMPPASAMRETVIFDLDGGADDAPRSGRLPVGQAVHLHLSREHPLELALSRHAFKLLGGAPPCLVDEGGARHALARGRNNVGRERNNDVIVDPGLHDVSRRHLVIDVLGDDEVALTDLSSHGTFVRAPGEAG